MEKMIQHSVLRTVLFFTLIIFSASCGDDDEKPSSDSKSCAALSDQIEAKYAELDEIGYNCDKMKPIFNDILKLVNGGKDCDELKALAKDEGFDSVEEYIDYLENYFNVYTSDCPG
jgi:hypothetical protein